MLSRTGKGSPRKQQKKDGVEVAKKGLGKGLDALFTDNAVETAQNNTDGGVVMLRLAQIEPCSKQPRTEFDVEAMQQLTESIKEHGIISPLVVRPIDNGNYQIVAGERRWRAARMAGLTEAPVIIREYSDRERAVIAMVENLQREDLNPIEEAKGYSILIKDHGLTQEMVANQVGKSRPAITNALRLMQLPEDVQNLVMAGVISAGHARPLISLGKDASEAARKIVNNELSVRETERLAARMEKAKNEPEKSEEQEIKVNYYEVMGRELTQKLGLKSKISKGRKKGRLEIEFYNDEDLNRLVQLLGE
jgi:ParB family chromosome partitioning protein